VLHVIQFSKNLISLSRLMTDNTNLILKFSYSSCFLKDPRTKTTIIQVSSSNSLFSFPSFSSSAPQAYLKIRASIDVWHTRLGHPTASTTLDVIHVNALSCISPKLSLCQLCYMVKAHKLPFSNSLSSTTTPLELIHSDV
jgi:hypothetical protein